MDTNECNEKENTVAAGPRAAAGSIRQRAEDAAHARAMFREAAVNLAFDSHVRRVHAAIARNREQFLRGPGIGEPLDLRLAGPREKDVEQALEALCAARRAGIARGRVEIIQELEAKEAAARQAVEIAASARRREAAERRRARRKRARR